MEPIPLVTVTSNLPNIGAVTDQLGSFKLLNLCPGSIELYLSHVGCETETLRFNLAQDTSVSAFLDHKNHVLEPVEVSANGPKTSMSESLSPSQLENNTERDLAGQIASIPGVSSIKTGGGISKPVIHGLSGNRLSIINNGVSLSGQQWGADHSPEIDPLAANSIRVLKGAESLEYTGNNLGSIVVLEPNLIEKVKGIQGKAAYFYESNGRGHNLNFALQGYNESFAWRVTATAKKRGDQSTPSYFLRNTGKEELNFSFQLVKDWSTKWSTEFYLSSYNARLGILRGAHIGNPTDLQEALNRDEPFYTENDFSYSIDAPNQGVSHHLAKFKTSFKPSPRFKTELSLASQYNLRKEYDVRRSGRTDQPTLSLEQFSNFLELKSSYFITELLSVKSGLQLTQVYNQNIPETGILPLIPDYNEQALGWFGSIRRQAEKLKLDFSFRYDFERRFVAAISNDVPREIIRYENSFHNLSSFLGGTYSLSEQWTAAYSIGLYNRNPEVNELYSNGLHQGVSGIEQGDAGLQKEMGLKNSLSVSGRLNDRVKLQAQVYHQFIQNYIYLNPEDEVRLTIRGAFPVFQFKQTDAILMGLDVGTSLRLSKWITLDLAYSYISGQDLESDLGLINLPSNRLKAAIELVTINLEKVKNIKLEFNGAHVFKQTNILASQDFVAVPDAYTLFGFSISAQKAIGESQLKLILKAENLFNQVYRDYLNRQRYFANDLGRNVVLGLNLTF